MGKKGKKGKKVVQMNTSPESYIKTRARSLPIGKCYINESWEETGFATVIVTRNHINGNFTFGEFLVDLYCLGIEETGYEFNRYTEYHELFDDLNEQYPMVEIDYPLAHNIICGSLKYAASLGFKPAKDFEISQYILEEDDDRIELIEIEFGYKGKPTVLAEKDKYPANIIATLERSVGKGNFRVIMIEDLEDDDYDYDDDDGLTDEKVRDIVEGRRKPSPTDMVLLIFPDYEKICTEKEKEEMCKIIDEFEAMEVVHEEDTDDPLFLNEDDRSQYISLYEKTEQGPKDTIPRIEALIAENPDNYNYFFLLNTAYEMLGDKEKVAENITLGFEKFPHKINAFTSYILIMAEQKNNEQLKTLIGSHFDFRQFFPNRQKISFSEMLSLIAALFVYFSKVLNERHKGVAYATTLCDFIFDDKNKRIANDVLYLASNLMMQELNNRKQDEDR